MSKDFADSFAEGKSIKEASFPSMRAWKPSREAANKTHDTNEKTSEQEMETNFIDRYFNYCN